MNLYSCRKDLACDLVEGGVDEHVAEAAKRVPLKMPMPFAIERL